MGITYEKADAAFHERVQKLMKSALPELSNAQATVTILLAFGPRNQNGVITGPAIMVGGYSAAAAIKQTSLKDRAAGADDAVMLIDADRWDNWSKRQQESILFHELWHLEPTGNTDDLGRPRFAMRKHDIQIGGFRAVIDRYKDDSIEALQVIEAANYVQSIFPWG